MTEPFILVVSAASDQGNDDSSVIHNPAMSSHSPDRIDADWDPSSSVGGQHQQTMASWNQTGYESYPPSLDVTRQLIHLACVSLGCPLNATVFGVILRQKRLRNPRNTFWLGIIVCNVLALSNALVEYAAFAQMDFRACKVFRVTAGIPYTVRVTN